MHIFQVIGQVAGVRYDDPSGADYHEQRYVGFSAQIVAADEAEAKQRFVEKCWPAWEKISMDEQYLLHGYMRKCDKMELDQSIRKGEIEIVALSPVQPSSIGCKETEMQVSQYTRTMY